MKLKVNRKSIKFEYECLDGEVFTLEYLAPTTQMINKLASISENTARKDQTDVLLEIFRDSLRGKGVDKFFKEQMEEGNIYDIKMELDEELGKYIKRK